MDDRIRKMREKILTSTDDAALTATELRSKYGKDEEMKPRSPRPSFADAPRQRSFASSSSNLRPSGTPSAFDSPFGGAAWSQPETPGVSNAPPSFEDHVANPMRGGYEAPGIDDPEGV